MKLLPKRHGWMRKDSGERNWSVYIDDCNVLVQGERAEEVSARIAEAFAVETTDSLVEQGAALFARGSVVGKRVSAGRWTPAVPDGFSWCVLDLQGSPLVLCNDATVALAWLNSLEAKTEEAWAWDHAELREAPFRAPSDEEIVDEYFADKALDLCHLGFVERHEVDAEIARRAEARRAS